MFEHKFRTIRGFINFKNDTPLEQLSDEEVTEIGPWLDFWGSESDAAEYQRDIATAENFCMDQLCSVVGDDAFFALAFAAL